MKLRFKKPTVLSVGLLCVFLLLGSVGFAQNPNQKYLSMYKTYLLRN